MKNLFLAIAFLLIGNSGFANTETTNSSELNEEIKSNSVSNSNKVLRSYVFFDEESCTLRQGHQVESNGEVTFQSITTFTFDGISCETLFLLIACGFNPAICSLIN